jgi:hypothetical protein
MDLVVARRAARRTLQLLRRGQRQAKRLRGIVTTRKVDFVVAGVQKGGTSALDAYLRQHPEICMADEKEVHFFDRESNFKHGEADYRPYHAYFSPRRRHRLLGEATPGYLYYRAVAPRLQAYNPDLKLLVILRDPVRRAYSQWNMRRVSQAEDRPFGEAIRRDKARSRQKRAIATEGSGGIAYVERGRYADQLEHLWRFFPREQTLVLKNEDLRHRPKETLAEVFAFLGVRPFPDLKRREVNEGRYAAPMAAADRDYLRALFEPEVRRLEALLGWDCSAWLTD